MPDGTVADDAPEAGLQRPRIWLDFGKLVVAAVVQGVVVSALVALVVMLLASGTVTEQASAIGATDGGAPAAVAAVTPRAAEATRAQ
ncbi:MAG: hypothetical protein M5U08_07540 [Burkholderiales bacterium]|nr:hypothetical protein [Burkholderiales bacterium]